MCSFGGRVSRFYFRYRLSFAPPVIFHNGANGLEFGRAREFPFRYRSCFVCSFSFFLSLPCAFQRLVDRVILGTCRFG